MELLDMTGIFILEKQTIGYRSKGGRENFPGLCILYKFCDCWG